MLRVVKSNESKSNKRVPDESGLSESESTDSRPRACAGTLMGKELYRVEDNYGLVIVTQRGDKRILSFDSNLEQSSIYMSKRYYLAHEYTQIMLLGLLFVEAENITLLGLGGGGLVHCLLHYFSQYEIQVVELRKSVIDVAYKWFKLPQKNKLKIYCSDAYDHLKTLRPQSANLIMSDLYVAGGMSEVQAQISFINLAHHVLSKQGCLVINFHLIPEADSLLMQEIHNVFSLVYICNVFKGNKVMFCCKMNEKITSDGLKLKTKELVKQVEMPLMYYAKQLKLAEKV